MTNENSLDHYFQGEAETPLDLERTKYGFKSRHFCDGMLSLMDNQIGRVSMSMLWKFVV